MRKILIIDDDSAIGDAVKTILELEGYSVVFITDAGQALKKAIEEKPNLILLDLLLSGDDGRTIASSIKQNEDTKHIPIIMLSAHQGAEASIKAHGIDDFLEKPFDIDDLLKKIQKHVPISS